MRNEDELLSYTLSDKILLEILMNKKTFYGEYTLLHWIELILTKNIVLPEYQRSFVWKKEQVENFLKKLKNGTFVPPVIIGSLDRGVHNENIILDGQQRLTSILLGYLGVYPKEDSFKMTDDPLYVSDSDAGDDDEIMIAWSFKLLTNDSRNKTKADILTNIENAKYDPIDASACLDDSFLNQAYLGFSYIVPVGENEQSQQKFYSTVFHDINQQGVALQGQESRRSLYYLNTELVPYFEPMPLINILKLNQGGKVYRYDYVRALALLTQFNKDGNEGSVAKRCKSQERFELYYEQYINAVVVDDDSPMFGKFSTTIGVTNISPRTTRLKESVETLGFNSTFANGIIEADTKLFGLIYQIVFKNKSIDTTRKDDLKAALDAKVSEFRDDANHRSSGLVYIRRRIRQSVDIYAGYVI